MLAHSVETVNDSARRAMVDASPATALGAATIVRQRTGAKLTALPLNDGAGLGSGWLLESEKLDGPEIYTDTGLIDFAIKLESAFC